jgi:hypothetical protein
MTQTVNEAGQLVELLRDLICPELSGQLIYG